MIDQGLQPHELQPTGRGCSKRNLAWGGSDRPDIALHHAAVRCFTLGFRRGAWHIVRSSAITAVQYASTPVPSRMTTLMCLYSCKRIVQCL
jgi:hypothetical protein